MKNACIVGFGAIGPVHAQALEHVENARLYAVCDLQKERADLAAEKYSTKAIYDFSKVLTDPEIDTVHICTPHYLHQSMAIACMMAGKDVVLEKPIVMRESELSELFSVYRQTGRHVCAILQNRMNPCVQKLSEIVKSGQYGALVSLSAFLTWSRDDDYYQADAWRGKWATEGGGVLINQAVHLLDLCDWLGGGIAALRCDISTKTLHIEVEDTADAVFWMKNGARGIFYATNASSVNDPFRLELRFQKGLFRYADGMLARISDNQADILASDTKPECGKSYWGNSHVQVISDFYQGRSYLRLEDALHSARGLFAMYRSAKEHRKIELEETT